LGGGWLSVAAGVVGVILPILPTVPFLVLAAFCFARSSPELERRLLEHPHYGESLRQWRERGAISRRAKRLAIGMMAVSVGLSWYFTGWPWFLAPLAALVLVGPWIWTRPD
jgi:uncharacterized membrane protein YbaN (DUF454 family)